MPTPAQQFLHAAPGFRVVDQEMNPLRAVKVAYDFGVDPGNGSESAGPVAALMRPGDPGRLMLLPFRGHSETASGGHG